MKTTILAFLILTPLCFGAQPDTARVEWLPAPNFNEADSQWVILPAADIYEVGTSRMANHLVSEMLACGFKELSEAEAMRMTGHHYARAAGKRPFLVRAVYGQDGIGAFRVERKANNLAVIWGGFPGLSDHGTGQSALVVSLDSAPTKIYNQSSEIPSQIQL
jgi:hypothetical protein